MRFNGIILVAVVALVFGAGCVGCESTPKDQPAKDDGGKKVVTTGGNESNTRVKAATAEPEPPFVDTPYFDRKGYRTLLKDDRLWVFEAGSDHYLSFRRGSEPAKNVTLPRAGPAGLSLRAVETETLNGYLAARPGFVTHIVDGRIWVFRPGSDALEEFRRMGEPAKHVIRPSAGPRRMTVKAPDVETLEEYLTARPGFITEYVDGRLWVFREGSDALAEFHAMGEPAKHVIRPRAGPRGMTLKAPDVETIHAYQAACYGFRTFVVDGRIWVFRNGDPEIATFEKMGEPAKHVIRPSAGPMRMTVKAPDTETVNDYLRAVASR